MLGGIFVQTAWEPSLSRKPLVCGAKKHNSALKEVYLRPDDSKALSGAGYAWDRPSLCRK